MAQIVLRDLVKEFGRVRAVDGVNLEVRDGEFMIFVGPSGCGKTTTLNMISGLETPTSGEVIIDGLVVNEVDPGGRGLGMVFQDLALFPHMTVFENIAFGLRVKSVAEANVQRRVRAAAEAMHIEKLLDKRPAQCSGGESQRVALARTIVTNPSLFLMDEPLSSLDAKLRVDMRTELKHLHKELNATFIYVTHDQAEAMTMGDRIVVMRGGHIQQVGQPLEIYRRPVNQFVGSFFGTPTMNFLEGELGSEGDTPIFRSQGLILPMQERLTSAPADRRVTLGVRAEHVLVGGGSFPGRVALTEPLGDETLVFFHFGGDLPLVAKVKPERSLSPGDEIRFGFDPAGFHLFGGEGGERLN